ncbi:MAG: hypothetical protein IKN32_10200 [Bacteroidales bacterium]|nr:hypothetical protein [Bacteroidales bacterium]
MGKIRQITFDKIEICRNCGGTGKEKTIRALFKSTCPVCNGSGRVDKHTEINITVEPHKEG